MDTEQNLDPIGSAQRTSGIGGASEPGRDSFVSKFHRRERLKYVSQFLQLCYSNVFKTDIETKNLRPISVVSLWRFLLGAKDMLVKIVFIVQK